MGDHKRSHERSQSVRSKILFFTNFPVLGILLLQHKIDHEKGSICPSCMYQCSLALYCWVGQHSIDIARYFYNSASHHKLVMCACELMMELGECVALNSSYWKVNPQCDCVEKWDLWEVNKTDRSSEKRVSYLRSGILIKWCVEPSFLTLFFHLLPWGDITGRSLHNVCSSVLDFPISRTLRNNSIFLVSYPISVILL
jgi:hypothetical protein